MQMTVMVMTTNTLTGTTATDDSNDLDFHHCNSDEHEGYGVLEGGDHNLVISVNVKLMV